MENPFCPACSREYVKRIGRRGITERLLSVFYVYPFRCQLCGHRFRALQFGVRYQRIEEDRREYERIPTEFPVTFTGDSIDGKGSVVDISMTGCTFNGHSQLAKDKIIRVVLHVSDDVLPISVEAAVVRSVHMNRVGLEFLQFERGERERLHLFIRGLLLGGWKLATYSSVPDLRVNENLISH